jgi:hypothetical protein
MMKKLVMAFVLLSMLGACGLTNKDLGLEKTTPDASNAKAKEALILPPNYNQRPVVDMEKAEK